ncbi:hypothetical protein F5B19DRAFT_497479 [Rostrohypoxylon terebratum]|nr:hypothetical protein F5B19DRAFT_497479 [Rostrohypoxylon terebratum]
MDGPMLFHSVRYADVEADMERPDARVYTNPKLFNTTERSSKENVAPEIRPPSNRPYSFKRWMRLILGSRSLSYSDIQTTTIPAEDEDVEFFINPYFEKLNFPPQGLTMHIDKCPAMDGAGKYPEGVLHSVHEVVQQLLTSQRALDTFTWYNDDNGEILTYYGSTKLSAFQQANIYMENGSDPFEIYFLPFDEKMTPESRYRVFCAPAYKFPGWKPQITAISQ